jgi:hypothetical protein
MPAASVVHRDAGLVSALVLPAGGVCISGGCGGADLKGLGRCGSAHGCWVYGLGVKAVTGMVRAWAISRR